MQWSLYQQPPLWVTTPFKTNCLHVKHLEKHVSSCAVQSGILVNRFHLCLDFPTAEMTPLFFQLKESPSKLSKIHRGSSPMNRNVIFKIYRQLVWVNCGAVSRDSLLDSWLYFNTLCLFLTFWKLDMILIHTVIALWHLVCTFCTVLLPQGHFQIVAHHAYQKAQSCFSDRSHQYDWIPKRNVVTVVPSRN